MRSLPLTLPRNTIVPSRCQPSSTLLRAARISGVPSPSRSATAGEASHDSWNESSRVAINCGAATVALPPPATAAHAGGGSKPSRKICVAPLPASAEALDKHSMMARLWRMCAPYSPVGRTTPERWIAHKRRPAPTANPRGSPLIWRQPPWLPLSAPTSDGQNHSRTEASQRASSATRRSFSSVFSALSRSICAD